MLRQAFSREVEIETADGIVLEGFLARPADPVSDACAVIAHPYGSLGGSVSDSVVQAVSRIFLDLSISTVVYNSRGVGGSTGKGSWSGGPERRDYQSVVSWVQREVMQEETVRNQSTAIIYCCGYSYGALMAATGGVPLTSGADSRFTLRYILISPPIGVSWLLTPFRTSFFTNHIRVNTPVEESGDAARPVMLIVYGDKDNFTSANTYRTWLERLVQGGRENQSIRVVEVEAGDHFWPKPGRLRLLEEVQAFIIGTR